MNTILSHSFWFIRLIGPFRFVKILLPSDRDFRPYQELQWHHIFNLQICLFGCVLKDKREAIICNCHTGHLYDAVWLIVLYSFFFTFFSCCPSMKTFFPCSFSFLSDNISISYPQIRTQNNSYKYLLMVLKEVQYKRKKPNQGLGSNVGYMDLLIA